MDKQRIAILGSGVGAVTTAWALTSLPDAKDRYDITIYTLGWRMGGKGASGRNADFGQRIEEHGLHIWMGFYDNAFKAMQECYASLNRPPSCPIRTWDQAFFPHDNIVLYDFFAGHWHPWPIKVPRLPGTPGTPRNEAKIRELFAAVLRWMRDLIQVPLHQPTLLELVTGWVEKGLVGDLHAAIEKAEDLERDGLEHFESILGDLERFAQRLESLVHGYIEAHEDVRRIWILLDLGIAVSRGMIKDGVLWKGFHAMAGLDFRAWLDKYGASDETCASSTVRTMYDLCFAYEDGELDSPNMDAAVLLRTMLLMGFTFRGAFMYRMSAGMGDIVFGPYYEALKQRGVRFEFFHKVTNLGVSADGATIDTIAIDRQASLAAGATEYQPFVTVKGLPCWPSTPNFDQLVDGDKMRQAGVNFESAGCKWPIAESRVLKRGQDFDDVVLGISLGAIPGICAELIARNAKWKAMTGQVLTVETQGVQLWLKGTLTDLGWPGPPSVAGTYAEPLDTWADMSDLLKFEDWPAGGAPLAVMYLCGPLRRMKPSDRKIADDWVKIRYEQVMHVARTWVQSHTAVCLPKGASPHNPSGLDLKWLHAPTKPDNPILDQYLRANIDPSERYVLSIAGTSGSRLRGSESGFANLALAGDWVWTPINAGCVEAATMGGLDAARKISGENIPVFGWASIDQPGHGDQN